MDLLSEIAESAGLGRQSGRSLVLLLDLSLIGCSCQLVAHLQLSGFLLEDLRVDVNDLLHYRRRRPLIEATYTVLEVSLELVLTREYGRWPGLHPLAVLVDDGNAFATFLDKRRHRARRRWRTRRRHLLALSPRQVVSILSTRIRRDRQVRDAAALLESLGQLHDFATRLQALPLEAGDRVDELGRRGVRKLVAHCARILSRFVFKFAQVY